MIISAEPDNPFSWDFFLKAGEHQAFLDKKWSSEQCDLLIDGELYRIRKHGPGSGQWTLEREGEVIVSGRKPNAFRRKFDVTTASGTLVLTSEWALSRSFIVAQDGELAATIRPNGPMTRKATMEVMSTDVKFPVAVFLFWLVVLVWRRQSS